MIRRADTLRQLFDFESQIEEAVESVLSSTGVASYSQRSDRELVVPRFEVQFTAGAATGSYSGPQTYMLRYPDAFNGSLKIRHITSRSGDITYTQHRQNVSQIRENLYRHEMLITEDVLPFLKLDSILENGSSLGVDEDVRHDITELTFAVVFFVRPSAWPSA